MITKMPPLRRHNKMLTRQAFIFLFVGGCTVLVDYVTYSFLHMAGFDTNLSKGLSFLIGATLAYYANKKITFNYKGPERFDRFIIVYGISLILNICINAISLLLLPQFYPTIHIAFILATGTSALFNFFGMKYFAFK